MSELARSAKAGFDRFQAVSAEDKLRALERLKAGLVDNRKEILEQNRLDVEAARLLVDQGRLSQSTLKRLDLLSSNDKYDSMVDGIDDVIRLEDPVGQVQMVTKLDDGLDLFRVTCPIGVLLIIFEARPEVITNIAALAIKSGNAAILKGGKESLNTQKIMTKVINEAFADCLPPNVIQTVSSRSEIEELLDQDQFIDLVIPRGSKELVQHIKNNTKIPVLGHADGLCSIYVDEHASLSKAIRCIVDAKTTYPAACNSVETLLIHRSYLSSSFPELALSLLNAKVTLKLDRDSLDSLKASNQVTGHPLFWTNCLLAKEDDYKTEWLSLTVSIRTVDSIQAAIEHINMYSSHHTDAIISESDRNGTDFCRLVNSASVYVNCSTRFADGYRYGFGTEVGISTSKIHSRGPVGLEGLVIYKWIMKGTGPSGHITSEYTTTAGGKKFIHHKLTFDECQNVTKPY